VDNTNPYLFLIENLKKTVLFNYLGRGTICSSKSTLISQIVPKEIIIRVTNTKNRLHCLVSLI